MIKQVSTPEKVLSLLCKKQKVKVRAFGGLLKSYQKNRDGWISLDYVHRI